MEITKSIVMHCSDSLKPLLDQLPKEKYWGDMDLYKWEGFWYLPRDLEAVMAVQSQFEARDDDVILASSLKTGSTWLKALCFSIMYHQNNIDGGENDDPFVKNHPAFYVQTLESQIFVTNSQLDLSGMPSPRLFHTHMAYSVLPDSIKNSKCKIVYITRNPKDTLVSLWHFANSRRTPEEGPFPFDKAFEGFSNGFHPFGPFHDHVLEYWKESLRIPHKILFLKYEELKRNPKEQMKRLASFLGRPIAKEEEADEVVYRCSLERLKNLEVNKNGVDPWNGFNNSSYFRLGAVGDWKSSFTPEMKERLDQITRKKLEGSGLEHEI